ncbi:MAG: dual specificity protein phosphatase family protein [Nitrospirota bacterium]|nr:dual specificity protein phosphatase family protein [Nitrospirota bacterium]
MAVRLRVFITSFALMLLLGGSYIFYLVDHGNFHTITDGEAYRSAQLDRDKLEYYIRRYNIRSILNLRGSNPDSDWYREELTVSAANRMKHYDIALSSTKEPAENDVKQLMEIFREAPRPILMHCQSGADRSGLVAAIWKVIVDQESKPEAEKQLSVFYGHVPLGGKYAMDKFFKKWQPSH